VVLRVEVPGPHHVEDPLGLGRVGDVGGPGRVAPAVRGEDERGRHVLLAVRRSAAGAPRARRLARPADLASALRHVVLDPFPEAIELGLMVQLNRGHHAVGHALGADIIVVDVLDVRFVGAWAVEVDRPRAAGIEERGPGRSDLLVALRLGFTGDGDEEIGVARGRRAFATSAAAAAAGSAASSGGAAVRAATRAPACCAAGGTTPASARASFARAPARGSSTSNATRASRLGSPTRASRLGSPTRARLDRRAPSAPGDRTPRSRAYAARPSIRAGSATAARAGRRPACVGQSISSVAS
jgi:hypothetical protein